MHVDIDGIRSYKQKVPAMFLIYNVSAVFGLVIVLVEK